MEHPSVQLVEKAKVLENMSEEFLGSYHVFIFCFYVVDIQISSSFLQHQRYRVRTVL